MLRNLLTNAPKYLSRISIPTWIAFLICFLAALAWGILLTIKYFSLGYYDWDLAMYSQVMWGLAHGSLTPSIFGINFLANHAEYITFLLIPLYALFAHPLTLIYLKIFSWVGGAFVLYLIGKNRIPPISAILIMLLYLFYPANIYAILYEFHFESLSLGLLMLTYYFFQTKKLIPFLITLGVTALIKENMPPVVAAFGFFALFARREQKWTWGLIPLLSGIAVFYLMMFILTPLFRTGMGTSNAYIGMYQDIGKTPLEIAHTFFFHPIKIFQIILQPDRVILIKELFEPLLWLPCLSPHILFLGSPLFLQHLLSSTATEHTIFYHYAATLSVFIFLAVIESLRLIQKQAQKLPKNLFPVLLIICGLLNLSLHMPLIKSKIARFQKDLTSERKKILKQIPPDAGVIATLSFLAPLSQRKEVYSFMNIVQNRNGLTWEPFQLNETVNYALIDFEDGWIKDEIFSPGKDPQSALSRIQNFLNANWIIKDAIDDLVLFERKMDSNPRTTLPQTKLIEKFSSPLSAALNQRIETRVDDQFLMLSCELPAANFQSNKPMPMTFFWKAEKDIHDNYIALFLIKKEKQPVFRNTHRIGYTIFPTNSWRAGDQFQENYWMLLPNLKSGEYSLEIKFYNLSTRQPAVIKKTNEISFENSSIESIFIKKIIIQNERENRLRR